jgi:integrase
MVTSERRRARTSGGQQPAASKTVVRLLTSEQVLQLAAVMPQRYALLVLLGVGAGLRQGEAFGLALDRVDTESVMITVDQQVVVVDRRPVLAAPKTSASLRDVPMPRFVAQAVEAHTDQLGLGHADVLCRTPRGTLLLRDYYNRNIWKPAIAAVGLAYSQGWNIALYQFGRWRAHIRGLPLARP